MKKALIVSPYLDHLGGGERYMLSVAEVLESLGWEITFAWDNLEEIASLTQMLGIHLTAPRLDPAIKPLYFGNNPLRMYLATRPYDTVVYLSDGSLPWLGARHNLIHMQVPFHGVGGKSWKNRLKKNFLDQVIVNSSFTKQIVDQEYGIDSMVVYPPVKPIDCSAPKEKIILSVGRFEPSLNAKKQDTLIKTWRALSPKLPGWKLVLLGGSSSEAWIKALTELADHTPTEIITNAPYDTLCELYAKSTIYWHAAGYGVDENKNPELTEHFGISTVEAISAGCIPLVVPRGGQKEIVTDPSLHWETKEELMAKTLAQINHPHPQAFDLNPYLFKTFSQKISQLFN